METDKLVLEMDHVIDVLSKYDPTTEEYAVATENLSTLNKIHVERRKLENEIYSIETNYTIETDKRISEKLDIQTKAATEAANRKKDYAKIAAVVGGSILLGLITIYAEETRVITSKVGQLTASIIKMA